MKDAFGQTVKLGAKVLYSTNSSAGTVYVIGKVVGLILCKPDPLKGYWPPDRVMVKVEKCNVKWYKFSKDPTIYASNVIVMGGKLTKGYSPLRSPKGLKGISHGSA